MTGTVCVALGKQSAGKAEKAGKASVKDRLGLVSGLRMHQEEKEELFKANMGGQLMDRKMAWADLCFRSPWSHAEDKCGSGRDPAGWEEAQALSMV